MIEINLLPEELRKKEPQFKKVDMSKLSLEGIPVLKIAGAAFGVLVAIQLLLFFIGIYTRTQYVSLENRCQKLLPRKTEADGLKKQVDTINKKIKAIDELMVKRFSWAKKLDDLSDSMTPGIWLNELSYNEKIAEAPAAAADLVPAAKKNSGQGSVQKAVRPEKTAMRYLIISGYASSMGEEGTALIGKFIQSLKDNASFYSDFKDIELGNIKRDKIEDQEVMSFKITCLFKETR